MTQGEALDILKTGANVFLTGEPGSGKTHTTRAYVEYLHSCGIEPAITASTGIAATHINGMTIHAWSGIGVRSTITDEDLDQISQREKVVRRVASARVLIIDEISMLSAGTLASVDIVLKTLRNSSKPFGGLQMVFVGDFFQLPPVQKNAAAEFAFASPAWEEANPIVCYLSEQHRQEDAEFLGALSAIRRDAVTPGVRATLLSRKVVPQQAEGITKLFPHNADVDRLNDAALQDLPGTPRGYYMKSKGVPVLVDALKRNCLSPETLWLKVGAKVMFTKNDMNGAYVNGTTGEVVEFDKMSGNPIVKTRGGQRLQVEPVSWAVQDGQRILAEISQLPLRLAWAMTVHKSQGMSLDAAVIDLTSAFEYGQGYVALSRVRTLKGLYLLGFNEKALAVHPQVAREDVDFREQSAQARETFATTVSPHELDRLHENFVNAVGGKRGAGRAVKKEKSKVSTYDQTLALVAQKKSLKEIVKERGMTEGTILSHLEKLAALKKVDPQKDLAYLKPAPARYDAMKRALEKTFKKDPKMPLALAKRIAGDAYSFEELRLARLFI